MFSRILHGVVMAFFILTILAFVGLGVYEIVHGTSFALWGIALGNRVLRGVLIMVFGVIVSFVLWSLVGTLAEIGLETRKTRKLMQELVDMNMALQAARYPLGLADAVPPQNRPAPQNTAPGMAAVQNNAPAQNRPPIQNPAPMQNRPPVQNPAPMQNRPPVQNNAPMQNQAPVNNAPMPMQNRPPMNNAPMPMQDRPPIQNPGPVQNTAPMAMQDRPPVQNPAPMQNTAPMPMQDAAPVQNAGVTQNLISEESSVPAGNDMKGTEGAALQNEIAVPDTDGQQKI